MNVNDTVMLPTPGSHASLIPRGYHAITPYLMVRGATKAISFYSSVFGATERMRMRGPNNTVMHAELQIGDSVVMLADEAPEMGCKSPESAGGSAVAILIYVPDVDGCVAKAAAAGAKVLKPVQNQFYGDRSGTIVDPFGHIWTVATHIEDVSPDEMQRRMAKFQACTSEQH